MGRTTGQVDVDNGEVLKFTRKLPDSGSIGLEADRGLMEYRNIRIKVLK